LYVLCRGVVCSMLSQVVLEPPMSMPSSTSSSSDAQQQQAQHQGPMPYSINPKLCVTRIGSRAYYKVGPPPVCYASLLCILTS
jgi:hypothetical protein